MTEVSIIDLFSGPGGLSEGFSRYRKGKWIEELSPLLAAQEPERGKDVRFKIRLSIEKDEFAHKTLLLRAFTRQFEKPPKEYFELLEQEKPDIEALYSKFWEEHRAACREARKLELGDQETATPRDEIDSAIRKALGDDAEQRNWLLIGGPPCQAYSLVGRARNKGKDDYRAEEDHRHFLYRDYLRIVAKHKPRAFVMENVTGILSSRVDGGLIFEKIVQDLINPSLAITGKAGLRYHLRSFVVPGLDLSDPGSAYSPRDFIVRCEKFGIPQRRHRVLILGILDTEEKQNIELPTLFEREPVPLRRVIQNLPRLESSVSARKKHGIDAVEVLRSVPEQDWIKECDVRTRQRIKNIVKRLDKARKQNTGTGKLYASGWFNSNAVGSPPNHQARTHMPTDLWRYLFCAAFAREHNRSPKLADFPPSLLPAHENAKGALAIDAPFADRFRVQVRNEPATTVTSHIAKDGHYFIHYDPSQVRALSVREAARIQTFPDDYLFCGPRTEQYHQVGNAVPPLLAVQLAAIVSKLF